MATQKISKATHVTSDSHTGVVELDITMTYSEGEEDFALEVLEEMYDEIMGQLETAQGAK